MSEPLTVKELARQLLELPNQDALVLVPAGDCAETVPNIDGLVPSVQLCLYGSDQVIVSDHWEN